MSELHVPPGAISLIGFDAELRVPIERTVEAGNLYEHSVELERQVA